jgi:hypothetical protein
MAKEWANKDKYHPPNGVLEPRVQMSRAKDGVRTVPAWADRKAVGVLTVKFRQPSHEFTFGVGMSFIPYPLVLTPVV